MKTQNLTKITFGFFLLVLTVGFAAGIIVDSNYITIYPGESEEITFEIENNENFDIEDVSLALDLSGLLFTTIGSSEKDVDDLDDGEEDDVSFTLRASIDIIPGDYNIPYILKYYVDVENNSEVFNKTGSFGLRVSAKTDLDFVVDVQDNAIVGEEGEISLEIINKGLGEIKSMSVQIFPQGFELLSKEKIFVGTIDADDSDTATFDVIYKTTNPILSAKVEYKDFDNKDQTETVNLSFKVYTKEKALELGILKRPNYIVYLVIGILVIAFIIHRILKKRKRKNRR
ncbi:hypothetical protein ES703_64343 [subsurface metagenome]